MSTPSAGDVGRMPEGAPQPTDPGGTFEPAEIDVKIETHLAHDTMKADTSLIETQREAVKPNRQDSQSPQLAHPSKADDPSAEQQIRRMPGLKKVLFSKRAFTSIYEELVEKHVEDEWQQALLDLAKDRQDEDYEETPSSFEGLSEESITALKTISEYITATANTLIIARKIENVIGAGSTIGRTITIDEDFQKISTTMMSEAAKIKARFPKQKALGEILDLFILYASSPLGKTSPAAAIILGVNASLWGVALRDFDGILCDKSVADGIGVVFEKLEEGMRTLRLKNFWPKLLSGISLTCVIITAAIQTAVSEKSYLLPVARNGLAIPSPNILKKPLLDLLLSGGMREDRTEELSIVLAGIIFALGAMPLSEKMEKAAKKDVEGPKCAKELQEMLMQGRGPDIPAHLARVGYQNRMDILSRDEGAQHASVVLLQNFLKQLLDVDDVWLQEAQKSLFTWSTMIRLGINDALDNTDQMFGDILSQA